MNPTILNTETVIFGRLVDSDNGNLSADVARALLNIQFGDQDRQRMHQLAVKTQEGDPTPEEAAELDCYRRVGNFLALLHSKARLSLNKADRAN